MAKPNNQLDAIPVFLVQPEASAAGGLVPQTIASGVISAPDYEDQRVLDGFGFTASTAIVAVASGSYLSYELVNPAGSGVNFIMTARVFSNNIVGGNAPAEYVRYAPASTLPGTPTVATVNNRLSGGAAAPTGTLFRYVMGTTAPTGTATSAGFIPTNGEEKRIKDIVIIPPNSKLIYAIGGAGGGLAAAARVAATVLFYTRPI